MVPFNIYNIYLSLMAKKQEEISKENTEAANKAIADQLNLVSQIQDKMAFILKTSKEKYTQDRLALDLTKQATNLTKSLASEYTSLKDVEKDIARNKKLQNEVSRTMLNLEKEIEEYRNKTIKSIWKEELTELLKEYNKWLSFENERKVSKKDKKIKIKSKVNNK